MGKHHVLHRVQDCGLELMATWSLVIREMLELIEGDCVQDTRNKVRFAIFRCLVSVLGISVFQAFDV